ncbi:MAG: HAMP domain-containing protein [Myxococcales bacterium]|nr:HAMP domain-containing protein [Myxococcales bacterium]
MRVSIRYQIVGLMGALLVAAVAVHVYLATRLVTEDKLASIYDVNSLLAGTLSEEVRAGLTSLVEKLLYLGAEQAAAQAAGEATPDRHARALFSTDTDVLSLEIWRRSPEAQAFSRTYRYLDRDRLGELNLTEAELEEARRQTPAPTEALAAERFALQNASLSPDLALLRLGAASPDGQMIVLADLRPDRLLRIFGRSDLYQVYLVDARGTVLVHPDPAKVIDHADLSGVPVVRDAIEAKGPRGAREFDHQGSAVIGSFARVDPGRLSVVVEVPKAEAMRASQQMTTRSLLFALFVISVALFASIFFSRRLSAPLRRLEEQMARISRGEFGIEVPVTSHNEIGALAEAFNKMSRELSERERALEEKNQQLIQSEKLSAIGELSAGLAHEVKNPMVGIVGFAQLGADSTTLKEAQEYFGLIESDAQRANGILQNLLEFARPQKVEMEPLEPNLVVMGAVRLVAHQLQIAGVKLETKLAEGLPKIRGNNNQLRQVLLNLMMNANQAMESCKEKRLEVNTRPAEGGVLIEVHDTGQGMAEEVRKKLFQPFFSTKPKGKGTGLGLSVSNSIIAHHKGEIRVESSPGAGTAFFIRLPAEQAERKEEPAAATG